jgi:hypothetical protein
MGLYAAVAVLLGVALASTGHLGAPSNVTATAPAPKPAPKRCAAFKLECQAAKLPFRAAAANATAPGSAAARRLACCDHRVYADNGAARFAACTKHLDDPANACANVMLIVEGSHDLRRRSTTQRMSKLFSKEKQEHAKICLVLIADPRLLDAAKRLKKGTSTGTLRDAMAIAASTKALAPACVLPNTNGGGKFLSLMRHLAEKERKVLLSFSSHGHRDLSGRGSLFGPNGASVTSKQVWS